MKIIINLYIHKGNMDEVPEIYKANVKYEKEKKIEKKNFNFEIYLNENNNKRNGVYRVNEHVVGNIVYHFLKSQIKIVTFQ